VYHEANSNTKIRYAKLQKRSKMTAPGF